MDDVCMYSIIPTLTENAIEFDMKKRVCGVVVVVFLPFSLKTEKESSSCVERSSRRFEQKTQRRKTLFFFLKRALIV